MEDILEILKYVLPSLVVFLTAYALLQQLLKNEAQKRKNEIVMGNQKIVTPIRLQAYERVTLFLERISPDLLMSRVRQPNMKVKDLQNAMITSIRREFEHNLSQQIYMTPDAWEVVLNAKESVTQLVYVAANKLDAEDSAVKLSKLIMDMLIKANESPVKKAVRFIKDETHHFLDNKPLYYPEKIRS